MDIELITRYVAVWGWQILSIQFLIASFIMFALPRTLITKSFFVGLFLIYIGCQFITLKRRKELMKNE